MENGIVLYFKIEYKCWPSESQKPAFEYNLRNPYKKSSSLFSSFKKSKLLQS
jgi:hypothetical protein